ncbi:unnamed protein product [Tilletia controversa]|uniref:Small ribosomal subunit protein mS35 mitochondrial conserved domain-containing protein n=1 Tax=Tilletia controversa TaxID=13291 RepID=A0A8X7MWJ5_9BASI|nr:hypothetical protein CF328_g87 [Tilletia controversa]KAE8252164.1 hypothetical protein A4X06_0g2388 [Tilletia controversa]CAD6905723.1 unnamed protein product [Tilletia controversa]CAD6911752.1 unnamed protein product [Tilletia controversa]CAD6970432.1 unnamed protein product [Tilletia controversa]
MTLPLTSQASRRATAGAARTLLSAGGASSSSSSAGSSSSNTNTQRAFSTSHSSHAKPRKARVAADAAMNIRKLKAFQYDDIPTLGHEILDYNRDFLRVFRLVELELPKLAAFRQPFTGADLGAIIKLRFVHHQGETHPENRKVVLSVNVSELFSHPSSPLPTPAAKHKFLLLAGERYSPLAGLKDARDKLRIELARSTREGAVGWNGSELKSAEANLSDEQEEGLRNAWMGQVKIGGDRFPNERMNATWCLDTLQKLIHEANQRPEHMTNVPLDPRPQLARDARAHAFGRSNAVSLRDFPSEWLS